MFEKLNKFLQNNESIHIQEIRYGDGYYCLHVNDCSEEDEIMENFSDLCCGDMDWYQAEIFFKINENSVLSIGETIQDSILKCLHELEKNINSC